MSVMAVVTGIWGFVVDAAEVVVRKARVLMRWLKKPGSLLKLMCAGLAFCSLTAGMTAYSKEQRIRELGNKIVVIQTQCDADRGRLEHDVRTRDQRLAQIADSLRAEADKLKALKAESAAAIDQLAVQAAAAERAAGLWRQRYEKRPDTCSAALEVLDTACADLEGY